MPAGSGPQLTTPVTSGSIGTGANSVTITTNAFSTGGAAGIIITVYLLGTPSATQTVTVTCYQGPTTGGTQLTPNQVVTFTGTTQSVEEAVFVDTSAFARSNPAGQYTVGFQTSTGTNTIAYAFVQLETVSGVS
jgi:hypothetical protein